MAYSEEALVRRIKGGDQTALEELVERWYPRVYAYAYRMMCQWSCQEKFSL